MASAPCRGGSLAGASLERLAAKRRAEPHRTIDGRIDDLVESADRGRALRKSALSYRGNWRDMVLFVCVLLFTIIWWDVSHSRSNWPPMFILLILLCVVAAVYAARGVVRATSTLVRGQRGGGE